MWVQCHIKNARVVSHMPEILYGVLPHLLMIHSFSTLLITRFYCIKSSVYLYSTFYLLFVFYVITLKLKHS